MNDRTDADVDAIFQRAVGDGRQEFGSFFLSRLFGMEVTYDADTCTVSFETRRQFFNPQGSLHGGVLATALDISMGHLLNHHVGAGATLEMKVQYFASVRSGQVHCQAGFLKRGRKVFFLQSHARDQSGECIALATSTWKLL